MGATRDEIFLFLSPNRVDSVTDARRADDRIHGSGTWGEDRRNIVDGKPVGLAEQ
jgi:hypothetical protein